MNVMGNGTASSRTQDRRFARTEKAIVEAFLKLAEEQDPQKITVTALAREADIDRKTFYLHYDTVDAVADALLKQGAERIAFDLIVVSGENGSQCHGVPTDKPLRRGDFITMDTGAVQ